jgi:sn-glycerol 3-phosphate transport system permease protein
VSTIADTPISAVPVEPAPPKRRRRYNARDMALAGLLLLPSLAVFGVFVFYPLVRTILLGFQRSDPFGLRTEYVGFQQYRDVLSSNAFHDHLLTTVAFAALTVPGGLVLGLALALLANKQLKGIRVFRTIFSSTVATSVAVASVMWLTLLNPSVGLLNYFLRGLGRQPVQWLLDPDRALIAVSFTTIWQNLGFVFIIFLAALQGIPDDLMESAEIDGASGWARTWFVTLPLLGPTLLFAFVVLTIRAFESFGQIDFLTQGGPLGRTTVIVYSIFQQTRLESNPGVAAAQAVVLFLIVLVLTVVQFGFLERRVHYGDLDRG